MRKKIISFVIGVIEKLTSFRFLKNFYSKVFPEFPVVIDVGTNRGQFIDFILNINKSSCVFGFEPNKKFENYLNKKYLNHPNVNIIFKGVSNVEGKKVFYHNQFDETSSFEDLNLKSEYLFTKSKVLGYKPNTMIKKHEEIEVILLGSFIKEKNIKKIDLIKFDVEGHEFYSLQGLFKNLPKKTEIKRIQIEHHEHDMYKNKIEYNEIEKLLNEHNYFEEVRYKHKFGSFYEIIFKNKD